jgi:hypothetical protein
MSNIIASPGVQFNEIDYTFNTRTPNSNTVYMMGFASQGPIYEPVYISTLAEYEQTFGVVTNSAERYLYHSARQILVKTQSQLLVTRLPYEIEQFTTIESSAAAKLNHSVLLFPVIPNDLNPVQEKFDVTHEDATEYHLLPPINVVVNQDTYDSYITNGYDWSKTIDLTSGASVYTELKDAATQVVESLYVAGAKRTAALKALSSVPFGMILTNDVNSQVNNIFEGLYVGFADNTEIDPSLGFHAITGMKVMDGVSTAYNLNGLSPGLNTFGYSGWLPVKEERLSFKLSAPRISVGTVDTVSEIVAKFPFSYPFDTPEFNDSLVVTLFSVKKSIYETSDVKLANTLLGGFMGSFNVNKTRVDSNGGAPRSAFIENIVNPSPYVSVFVNRDISRLDWEDTTSTVARSKRKIRISTAAKNLYALGVYGTINSNDTKQLGIIPDKVEIGLRVVESADVYPIDVTCDAGLSTIWTGIKCKQPDPLNPTDTTFNDEDLLGDNKTITPGPKISDLYNKNEDPTRPGKRAIIIQSHNAIASLFTEFASTTRKDHVHVSDPLRYIFIEGQNFKKINRKPSTTLGGFNFFNEVYWPLAHIFNKISTSYVCTYPNWFSISDGTLRRDVWIPPSGVIAANIINSSPFEAPAGFTRGVINGISDVAISPSQKERDKLYQLSFNGVSSFPGEGVVIYGQKTLLNKPSAFDRLNVRRTFIYLEKATNSVVKYFVFEPNSFLTRNRIVNTLTPIYENAKSAEGIYDYKIVCDERNNPPSVIDDNRLVVDIYVKPTRTAEFILVNFYATRTDQNFNELVANA